MDIRKVEEIALNAGKILLEKLQSGVLVEKKGAIDLITGAIGLRKSTFSKN